MNNNAPRIDAIAAIVAAISQAASTDATTARLLRRAAADYRKTGDVVQFLHNIVGMTSAVSEGYVHLTAAGACCVAAGAIEALA